MSDPVSWSQPRFSAYPILDGAQLANFILTGAEKRVVLGRASLFRMASGAAVIQRPLLEDDASELVRYYEWELEQEGGTFESDWNAVSKQMSRGAAVSWIDYDVEHEAFTLKGGAETFTLQRPTAASVYLSFDISSFPNVALLDGVAQTVVDTGSPASGEVSIAGSAVVVPSDVASGQMLEVRYYPSYSVVVMPAGVEGLTYNALERGVTLVEV